MLGSGPKPVSETPDHSRQPIETKPTRKAPTPRRQISTVKKSPGPPRPPRPPGGTKTQNPRRALPPVPHASRAPQNRHPRTASSCSKLPAVSAFRESCPDACANLRAAATPRRRPRQGGVVRLRCISPTTPSRCPARQPEAKSDSCSPNTSHGHRGPPRPDVTTIETRHERPPINQMLDGPFIIGQRPPPKGRDGCHEPAPQQTQEEEGPERAAHDVGQGPS